MEFFQKRKKEKKGEDIIILGFARILVIKRK